ncbi:MAG: metallophosphoesterase, partial [candidate division WOR-3 bacterium]
MKRLSVLVLTLSWGFGGFVKLPYLQSLTDSSVVLCWEQSDSAPARIEFGLSLPPGQVVLDSSRSRCREVLISGLVSDTCYYYRVIVNGDTSPTCRFRTPSVSMGHFRLVAYGDNRTDSAAHQQVVNRLLQTVPPPMLLINVGDLTENGTEEEFQTFFNISRELLGGFPLFPAIGNHEMRNIGTFLNRFVLPGNEHYYTVRWGNAVFHVLDNYSDFSPGSEQYNWLVNQLLQDSATPSLRHIFIVFHEPPWTTSL